MTPPVLVTPPSGQVVPLADLKAHLRVDHADEDALIQSLHDAAVAHLEGWRGVLGRAIRSQVCRVTVEGPGPHLLPMPDVVVVTATAAGSAVTVTEALTHRGLEVTLPDGTVEAVVTFTCEMPAQQRPAAEAAVKLLVGHWYENRLAVVTGTIATELPMAVDMLIGALRWRAV